MIVKQDLVEKTVKQIKKVSTKLEELIIKVYTLYDDLWGSCIEDMGLLYDFDNELYSIDVNDVLSYVSEAREKAAEELTPIAEEEVRTMRVYDEQMSLCQINSLLDEAEAALEEFKGFTVYT